MKRILAVASLLVIFGFGICFSGEGVHLESGERALLFSCTGCHPLSDVLRVDRDYSSWWETIGRMSEKMRLRGWKITKADQERIAGFLAQRQQDLP